MSVVRQLTSQDIPAALTLSSLVDWNQTAADWRLLLSLQPEGCYTIACDGRPVATTTLVCYGTELAWIGMVLTHPDYRHKGFAHRLVERALRLAEEKSVFSVKLDATAQGRSLYESLGFREEQPIERWVGSHFASDSPPTSAAAPQERLEPSQLELDRTAFGVDRSELLKLLTANGSSFVSENGFVLSRAGSRASQLGPCVSRSPHEARGLIEQCLGFGASGAWYWDLLPSNGRAREIAAALGFHVDRTLVRMVKGPDLRGDESMLYAGAAFELG